MLKTDKRIPQGDIKIKIIRKFLLACNSNFWRLKNQVKAIKEYQKLYSIPISRQPKQISAIRGV